MSSASMTPLTESIIHNVFKEAKEQLAQVKDADGLESMRVAYFGKRGQVTQLFQQLKAAPKDDMRTLGALLNVQRSQVLDAVQSKKDNFAQSQLNEALSAEAIDVTLPGRHPVASGSCHPITWVMHRAITIWSRLGFSLVEGPEIEKNQFNFDRLNIPEHHPARSMQDSFVPDEPGMVLRTHTSPVQVRVMDGQKPPIQIISLGRVFRRDSDPTHTPMFHQLEGLHINETANFSDLKTVIEHFFNAFFDRSVSVRFRPSYFPFTEPSAEVDIKSESGEWLEVMGCGMVHPNVLEDAQLSPDTYQGYAFGFGLDRLAMLYYGIDDLRTLFEGDIAFLSQFH
jgi:phenylalanyl-tRNA synthetase alpha chain